MFSLVIDQGNTLAKVYLFDQDECVEQFSSENLTLRELGLFLVHKQFDAAIIAGVKALDEEIIHFISNMCRTLILNADTELPIHNAYQSPATLGSDRIAGACAAAELFPQKNCLIIDAGTCVTYDIVSKEGVYFGGAISLGLKMRSKALHSFTENLPKVEISQKETMVGEDTQSSMQVGVEKGFLFDDLTHFYYRKAYSFETIDSFFHLETFQNTRFQMYLSLFTTYKVPVSN